jgi:hypothetical protein
MSCDPKYLLACRSLADGRLSVLRHHDAGRKVALSRTLRTAEWANTTIAACDTTEEIDKLRRGGDGHVVVWGGVSFWRSLMRLDLAMPEVVSSEQRPATRGTQCAVS